MRAWLVTVLVSGLLGTGCGCPPSPCRDWVYVDLVRDGDWQAGTWLLEMSASRLSLRCTVTIPVDGWAPTVLDVDCNDRVDRAAFLVDTGLWDGASPLRLQVPLTEDTADEPPSARVVLRHTPPGGAAADVSDETIALPWRPGRPQAGACAADCLAAEVQVVVPDLTS